MWSYFQSLTMEQVIALAIVAKLKKSTPDAVVKQVLTKHSLTVYPKGDRPQAPAPPVGPEHPIGYSMAVPETCDGDVERCSLAHCRVAGCAVRSRVSVPESVNLLSEEVGDVAPAAP